MLLADVISDLVDFLNHKISDAPYVLAVSGGQGAGKSTMCKALEEALTPKDKKLSPYRWMIFITAPQHD